MGFSILNEPAVTQVPGSPANFTSNGIEGWFGTDPGVGNAGQTQVGRSGNEVSFEHPVADPALTDITGSYEWSLDLSNWNAPGDTAGGVTVDLGSTTAGANSL